MSLNVIYIILFSFSFITVVVVYLSGACTDTNDTDTGGEILLLAIRDDGHFKIANRI